ncbi:MAG: hypothetical protein ABSG57_01295 [Candidatus Bathyarchaeia archaeon]
MKEHTTVAPFAIRVGMSAVGIVDEPRLIALDILGFTKDAAYETAPVRQVKAPPADG